MICPPDGLEKSGFVRDTLIIRSITRRQLGTKTSEERAVLCTSNRRQTKLDRILWHPTSVNLIQHLRPF
jgi:hypothetical protein